MAMFREFFLFELKFRFKSASTYVYFAIWFAFNFLNVFGTPFLKTLLAVHVDMAGKTLMLDRPKAAR